MGLFGKNRKEAWHKVVEEMGFQLVEGGLFKPDKMIGNLHNWTITLDTYTVSTGKSAATYTRIRAPYSAKDDFRFKIYQKGIFSNIGKLLGSQDVEIGIPSLDENFIIQGNDEAKMKTLFTHESIQKIIEGQDRIRLEVKEDDGFMGTKFPEGVKQLYFEDYGVIKDEKRLVALFYLFGEVLKKMSEMDAIENIDPQVTYK
ncbi:DUF3137 domain-containing protein [Isachenkonia alkalipeptolytica]|uniref:DUF3137 domain-containing protein n=1 Tax=Isachenkonia alkalipeptolytica TaxID=2565777 RepID=A0AA44BFU0_9CLOT|nr:DUF3137 domain-containing protein [Isachenkonia alkalipeptolytica]NBG88841.1 DUF3137 domain-containing protein [Isachenkonia alkalipeptolytica]